MQSIMTAILCECGRKLEISSVDEIDGDISVTVEAHTCEPTETDWDSAIFDGLLSRIGRSIVRIVYRGKSYRGFFPGTGFTNGGFDANIHVAFFKFTENGAEPRVMFISEISSVTIEDTGFRYHIV